MNDAGPERFCAFCGLPLSASFPTRRNNVDRSDEYCCSGCRAVASVDDATQQEGAAAHRMFRLGLAVFFAMNVMVFTMALWSQNVYEDQAFATPLAKALRGVFRWAAMLFSAPVLFLLGGPIAAGVRQALRRGAITTDLLILLGVGAAYAYSAASVLRGDGHVYFEVGVMVLILVSIGRWLEAKGKRRASDSLDAIAAFLPAAVRRLNASGQFEDVPREAVRTGDRLRVLPGERFAVDGIIAAGAALVDDQIVTGESRPVERATGEQVHSGAVNLDGDLQIEVTASDGRETISRLLKMVRDARRVKGRHERLVDQVAKWFVPAVIAVALFAGWQRAQSHGWDDGILTGLAVALIACPCALGLATPMAVWTALGRAAEGGVLFRSGVVLERLAATRVACFDKTGTLTTGVPTASHVEVAPGQQRQDLLDAAARLAAGSNHPLAQAIARMAPSQDANDSQLVASPVETIAGRGLACDLPTKGRVVLGSRRLIEESGLQWPSGWTTASETAESSRQQAIVGWHGKVRGLFLFEEQPRPEAVAAIDSCRSLGLELRVLTGDRQGRATLVSEQVDIPSEWNLLPEDKVESVRSHRDRGGVAMIGEGLNDAPALAASDVGVALGCGTDLSRNAAGVCLVADDLRRFPWSVGLARRTVRIVKQNLFWAFAYNVIGIALAATGRLNPILAALAMALSSAVVVSNSLRLRHYPEPPPVQPTADRGAERLDRKPFVSSASETRDDAPQSLEMAASTE